MRPRVLLRWLGVVSLLLALALPSVLDAKGATKGSSGKTSHAKAAKAPKTKSAAAPRTASGKTPKTKTSSSASAPRKANGKLARSEAAKHQFEAQSGYPKRRPGYVVDHIKPLAWRGRRSEQHAMADCRGSEGEGQDRARRVPLIYGLLPS